jgi:hypothetical protein
MQEPFANSFSHNTEQNWLPSRRSFSIIALIALIAVCTVGLTLVAAHDGTSVARGSISSFSELSSGMPLP